MGQRWNRHFITEKIQMASKHLKWSFTFLVIREMQTKTKKHTTIYSPDCQECKRLTRQHQGSGIMWSNGDFSVGLVGNLSWYNHFGELFCIPH